jgi:hypothetical protein
MEHFSKNLELIMSNLFHPAIASLLVLACVASTASAQEIMLTPGTLVLDAKDRSGEITVGNPGDSVASFRVEDSAFIQADDGQLSANSAAKPAFSAQEMLRVGPRRFVLASGEGQTVRVAARVPEGLAPGEYRSHLSVTNLAEQKARADIGSAGSSNPNSVSISIPMHVAYGVRVLLRHNVSPEGGRPSNVSLRRDGANAFVGFDVDRLGATSLLASAEPFAQAADGRQLKAWTPVPTSIYAELPKRHFEAQILSQELPPDSTMCVRLKHSDPGAPKLADTVVCAL